MSLETNYFEFGEFLLDAGEKVLLRQGKPVQITPKVFQMLLVLIENHGRIVEKNKLMELVWKDSFVEESNLTFTMRQLRKILGDDKHHPRFVETIARRGYRFIAEVRENQDGLPTDKSTASTRNRDPRLVLYSIFAVFVIFSMLTAGFFIWREKPAHSDRAAAQTGSFLNFETLASEDNPIAAAISPDGKYIAYTNVANGQMSLWLRQLSSGINTQIIAPAEETTFYGIRFSATGEYIYFARRYRDAPVHLDRVSIFGGAVKTNILSGLDGAFSISPDDRLISFRRYEPQKRSLLVADIDGGNIRPLLDTPKTFTDNVFSPDGKQIAFASGQSDTGDRDFGVYTVDLKDGDVKPASDFRWFHVHGIVWLPDQSGLIVTGRIKNDEPQQLWQISLPGGEVRKITHTQNAYNSISATADLSQILLTQISLSSNLYLASAGAPGTIQPLTQAYYGVVWTPEGNLVYSSPSNGNHDIWLLDTDKKNRKQLTTENSSDLDPRISPDGRYIVFTSDRAGKNNLWRMNSDGSEPVQLTGGEGEQNPVFTADGQFVVFNSMKDMSLWKVSIEGGAPARVSDKRAYRISISPDASKFAHFAQKDGKTIIAVKSFANDELLQQFALPEGFFPGLGIVWTKDGKSLIYSAADSNSTGNLWQQSLSGDPPQELTHYNSEEIFYFDFSPDFSQFAVIRGSWNYSVVLVKGFQK
jgi:Tol biopolymer transport system component/DNA-binding winged helix-turn-helix (wHTH) protein